ncbi:tafazzin homolog [Galendromus occidentalis]|uniref:Tafazzin family protein n=1 Tax=Galendromus occidentalis TaxID=34638 RepID=A0AAJ6QTD1_9ACAR|nr:tafazzin homolog [Galendromus occidentalis]
MPLDVRWPMPPAGRPSAIWNVASHVVMPTVGSLSKMFAELCSYFRYHNVDRILAAVEKRPSDVPLITASNHHSCLDDPIIWSMLPMRILLRNEKMRWSLAAHDICYTRELHSNFFALGQCIPVVRGDGVYQRGMNYCVELLNLGKWVHIYPEGRVNTNPKEFLRLKWGVGRLISDSRDCPIVIPFWHIGMDKLLPNIEPYRPHVGQVVTLNVGLPIDFSQMKLEMEAAKADDLTKRKAFTDVIQTHFATLREETEALHELHLRNRRKAK